MRDPLRACDCCGAYVPVASGRCGFCGVRLSIVPRRGCCARHTPSDPCIVAVSADLQKARIRGTWYRYERIDQ